MKKRVFYKYILIFLMLLGSTNLFAQTSKYTQKVEWSSAKNASSYKVEIRPFMKASSESTFFTTTNTYVEFSMPAGTYEYRVYVYDYLGRVSNISQWQKFAILKITKPEISKVENNIKPVIGNDALEIPVDVQSVTPDSKVMLVNTESGEEVPGELILKDSASNAYSQADIAVFPIVDDGKWKMVITNPGGLTAESEELNIGDIKEPEIIPEEPVVEPEEEVVPVPEEPVEPEPEPEVEETAVEEPEVATPEEVVIEEPEVQEEIAEPEVVPEPEVVEPIESDINIEEIEQTEEPETEEVVETEPEKEPEVEEVVEPEVTPEPEEQVTEPVVEEITELENTEEVEEPEKQVSEPEEVESEEPEEEPEVIEKPEKEKTPYKVLGFSASIGGGYNFFMDMSGLNIYKNSQIPPVSARASLGFVPVSEKPVHFGVEAQAVSTMLYRKNSEMIIAIPYLDTDLNFIFRVDLIKEKLSLDLKAGGGATFLFSKVEFLSDPAATEDMEIYGYLNALAGVSVVWTPAKYLQIEIGTDCNYDFITSIPTLIVNPYINLGVRF